MLKAILGIDVAKLKLDVALMIDSKVLVKQFTNNIKGFKLLQGWLASLHIEHVHACLEATGIYGDAFTEFLYERGTPAKVIINEALELARTYSADDSVRFINGILDAIRRRLERE